MTRLHCLFIFALLVALICCVVTAQDSLTVTTPLGQAKGYLSTTGSGYIFRAIPYAQAGRWQHSTVKTTPFAGIIDNKEDGSAFPQNCMLPPHTCPETYSEDSFTMNIFTPKLTAGAIQPTRPVMVFLHGGNFFQGSGGGPLYNSTAIAGIGDVVVVTVNYRLGILGFFRSQEDGIYGNYGLVDQINALRWVQSNIKAFGGDPSNVTIFGQSAGGASVASLLVSKYTEGLFHKAIVHSNPFSLPFKTVKTNTGMIKAFKKHAGCTDTACLFALNVDDLIVAQTATATDLEAASGGLLSVFMPFLPYLETKGEETLDPEYPLLLPAQLPAAFAQGYAKKLPLMIGMVSDEADLFIHEAFETPLDETGYKLFAWLIFGDEKSKKALARFPPLGPDVDHRGQLGVIGTQFIFQCAERNATRALIAHDVSRPPVYMWVYDYLMSFNNELWGPDFPICTDDAATGRKAKVCHAADIVSFFNSAQFLFPYTAVDQELTNQFDYAWVNFAKTGNPNVGSRTLGVKWESYQESKGGNLYFGRDGKISMASDYLGEECNWWDKEMGYVL